MKDVAIDAGEASQHGSQVSMQGKLAAASALELAALTASLLGVT